MSKTELQENLNKLQTIKSQLGNSGAVEVTKDLIEAVKEEIGDYKLTREMRKNAAKELGVDEETASGWQKMVDVLDHIDTVELAKKHPEKINKGLKVASQIAGTFFAPVGKIGDWMPEKAGAKAVEIAGSLTPEHLLNTYAKHRIKKEKEKLSKDIDIFEEKNVSEVKKVKVRVKPVKRK